MDIVRSSFGKNAKGEETTLFRISSESGMRVCVTDQGATLVAVWAPDRDGIFEDVLLGYEQALSYDRNRGHLGAVVGRNANRIGGARFLLGDQEIVLAQNDRGNNLHSGPDFWENRLWGAEEFPEEGSVRFTLHSPDGDQGFPGNADVSVTYTLTPDNVLRITYRGVSDKKTVFNMTNHSYFNLAGQDAGSILDHELQLFASWFTPAGPLSIPTGEVMPVEGTPMDFRTPHRIGERIGADFEELKYAGGYDHNWIIDGEAGTMRPAAVLYDPKSGRKMTVSTDLPAVQFYTGNMVHATGKGGQEYTARAGLCLETQYVPNVLNFERSDMARPVFEAGSVYTAVTEFRFSAE